MPIITFVCLFPVSRQKKTFLKEISTLTKTEQPDLEERQNGV